MQLIRKITRTLYTKFIPPKPVLGRWNVENKNYIKTDLANHDCCGDKLCGDPKLTKEYITENLNDFKKN